MKIIELTISDNPSDLNLEAISLVEEPAVEINFMIFSKNNQTQKKYIFTENKIGEKQMVYGPALIPDKLILRQNEETGEYYSVYFSKQTVDKCMNAYMSKNFNKFTVDHENNIKNIRIIENWKVEDPKNDKANHLGFQVPAGTWMTGAKVDNEMIWEKIKAGELRGFSIEGFFVENFVKQAFKKEVDIDDFIEQQLQICEKNLTDKNLISEKIKELYAFLKNK